METMKTFEQCDCVYQSSFKESIIKQTKGNDVCFWYVSTIRYFADPRFSRSGTDEACFVSENKARFYLNGDVEFFDLERSSVEAYRIYSRFQDAIGNSKRISFLEW
jgi:hypothetical protein